MSLMPAAFSPDSMDAAAVIRRLDLAPLPSEGGFFRRTLTGRTMGQVTPTGRAAWSAILALFTADDFSALHRVRAADELWIFQAGDPLELVHLPLTGALQQHRLGLDPANGERLQAAIPAGDWQGARLAPGGRWALVTCVVVPEFVWTDFELADRAALQATWPEHADLITGLTRE